MTRNQKTTISDVAERAGVSAGTVSRVLNRQEGAPETRRRVVDAARKLGYRPDMYASGMRSNRKRCMGILVESSLGHHDPWLEKVTLAMADLLSEAGYRCMLEFWSKDEENLPRVLDSVDGCMLLGDFPEEFFSRVEREVGLPLVNHDEKMPYENGASLRTDWQAGVDQVVQYLLAFGHTKVGLVVAGTRYPSLRARYEGFLEAMPHFGHEIDDTLVAATETFEDRGYETARRLTGELLDRRPDLTGIVYGSDLMAFGGMRTLKERGLEVPADVSVVGFDDTDAARTMVPPLTSVGVDYKELAMRQLHCLETLIGERTVMPDLTVRPRLVRRESVTRCEEC